MAEAYKVKFWRGSRKLYEFLKEQDALSYWMRYSVKNENGTWSEYYGDNQIAEPSGQLLPVKSIVDELPTLNLGDRYLLCSGDTYYIVSVTSEINAEGEVTGLKPYYEPLGDLSVRVKDEGLKCYQVVDGELKTYDDVDCGDY